MIAIAILIFATILIAFAIALVVGIVRDKLVDRRGDLSGDDLRATSGIGVIRAIQSAESRESLMALLAERGLARQTTSRHRSSADDRPMWAAPTPRQLVLVRCPVPGYRVGELVGAA